MLPDSLHIFELGEVHREIAFFVAAMAPIDFKRVRELTNQLDSSREKVVFSTNKSTVYSSGNRGANFVRVT